MVNCWNGWTGRMEERVIVFSVQLWSICNRLQTLVGSKADRENMMEVWFMR